MSDNKHTGRGFGGKGYYIALILCAAAIGISGYLYYRNANDQPQENSLQDKSATVSGANGDDVAVIATRPITPEDGTKSTETTAPSTTAPLRTASPVSGETVGSYAMDCLSYNETTRDWRVHNGIDIAAQAGTEVCAAADGTVYTVYDDETMGTTVVIRHDGGYTTKYSSLSAELTVAPGDDVTMGQVIGTVGNSALLESALGDHVHFSVTCNDVFVDPVEFLELG